MRGDRFELRRLDRATLETHLAAALELEAASHAELGDAYSHEPWSAAHFLAEREGKWQLSAGAFEGGRLIGILIASRSSGGAHLHRLVVRRESRRAGIARALIEFVTRSARVSGVGQITLSVSAANQDAIAVWERLGFRPLDGPALEAFAAERGIDVDGGGVRVEGRPYRIFALDLSTM